MSMGKRTYSDVLLLDEYAISTNREFCSTRVSAMILILKVLFTVWFHFSYLILGKPFWWNSHTQRNSLIFALGWVFTFGRHGKRMHSAKPLPDNRSNQQSLKNFSERKYKRPTTTQIDQWWEPDDWVSLSASQTGSWTCAVKVCRRAVGNLSFLEWDIYPPLSLNEGFSLRWFAGHPLDILLLIQLSVTMSVWNCFFTNPKPDMGNPYP